MIFKQTMMQMTKGNKQVPRLVMVHESGLAIHRGEGAYSKTWVISHFNSGRSLLRYIKKREDIENYIWMLIKICEDWNFTLEEFDESEWKHDLKTKVDTLQKEILGA